MARKPELSPHDMLQKEYEYITQTAFQANEDRSRVTSFYFVSVGSFVAAILSTQFEQPQKMMSFAFFVLFLILTFMGALTIAQLARLRAAWHESAEAMNQIKEFYIQHHPEIEPAIKWKTKHIPPTNKPNSIANLIAIEVAMLGALTTGAAVYFLMNYIGEVNWLTWIVVMASFILGYIAQWRWYIHLLVDDR
ncbi:MAG TPA: hypothetical protein PKL78_05405 [Anaerolineales bacterium]|nr:hypothetical protein [Anaerolineales bacterium]HNN12973.1 hypothetical protein [Anaerolineales bacterium]HNO31943.1 hypothetical protein [Anaerolineales bacterium]